MHQHPCTSLINRKARKERREKRLCALWRFCAQDDSSMAFLDTKIIWRRTLEHGMAEFAAEEHQRPFAFFLHLRHETLHHTVRLAELFFKQPLFGIGLTDVATPCAMSGRR